MAFATPSVIKPFCFWHSITQCRISHTFLSKSDGTAVNFTKDGTNIIKINGNGSSDVIDSSLFVAGSYYLQETKAPDGYMMSEPKSFTISSTDAGKTLQIEVYDDKLVVLPVTGGEGRDKYISLTCILMAMSISLIVYKKRSTVAR